VGNTLRLREFDACIAALKKMLDEQEVMAKDSQPD
jgi:hypothetical protein